MSLRAWHKEAGGQSGVQFTHIPHRWSSSTWRLEVRKSVTADHQTHNSAPPSSFRASNHPQCGAPGSAVWAAVLSIRGVRESSRPSRSLPCSRQPCNTNDVDDYAASRYLRSLQTSQASHACSAARGRLKTSSLARKQVKQDYLLVTWLSRALTVSHTTAWRSTWQATR